MVLPGTWGLKNMSETLPCAQTHNRGFAHPRSSVYTHFSIYPTSIFTFFRSLVARVMLA